ncbi:MAG: hypothetical protein AMXMBFR56_51560 [Polyangiaceae bacterium]
MTTTAPAPTPNLPDADRVSASAAVDFVDAPDAQVCSEHGGLKDFCVKGFRTALTPGIRRVLSRYFEPANGAKPDYHARFKLIEFSHSPTSGASQGRVSVQVAMRWHFTLKRSDGTPVIDLTETTTGPQQTISVSARERVIAALDNAVLERLAKALGDARAGLAPPARNPPSEAPHRPSAQACVPGATQECVGPGGCRGGQSCVPAGSGFSPCDCGGSTDGGAN